MYTEEHLYSIALRRCALIGDINFRRLVEAEGSAAAVWHANHKLLKTFGIGHKTIADIGKTEHLNFAENELQFCSKNSIRIYLNHLQELPYLLPHCDDAPAILYAKWTLPAVGTPVSLVGTRNMTGYGKSFIEDFLGELKTNDIITVSGLAMGVDAYVHEISLEKQIPTIAVLAHGLHTIYPSQHRKLAEKIVAEGGALVTEFNSSQKPDREHFIQRNRIIAGISSATIVVETAFGGGSVSTAGFANQYNRDVFALPGRISDKYSQGCNHLIYNNKASAISTVKDLLSDLKLNKGDSRLEELFPHSVVKPLLRDEEQQVFEAVQSNPKITLDDLSEKLNIPAYKLLPILLQLELNNYVSSFSGRQYAAL